MRNGKPTLVSLFSGCGGSSLGYKRAGFRELLAVDFDKKAAETFKLNFPRVPCWQRDIRETTGKEIMEFCGIKKGELDLLDASPPCQGFSTAGKMKVVDGRNDLFLEFARLIRELKPRAFLMENVSGLLVGRMKGKFMEIMEMLKSLPYRVKCKLMNAMYYDVPQSRPRLIWIGTRRDLKRDPEYPVPNNRCPTVRMALKDCPDEVKVRPKGKAGELTPKIRPYRDGSDMIPDSYFNLKRLAWDRPSRTITHRTRMYLSGHIHPDEDRFLTIAELKRLSTFPDDFQLVGNFEQKWGLIGNSVPPKFMEAIARTIKERILCHAPTS